MTGQELRAIREQQGWTWREMSEILSEAVGRKMSKDSLEGWGAGRSKIPADAAAFLAMISGAEPRPRETEPAAFAGADADTSPAPDGPQAQPALLYTGSTYAKVCEQFFELIATGIGMVGAAIDSPALREDCRIIDTDKVALGAAWGKLAETNEVFRNMILATDRQGAYLAVALATGTTAGKVWRNHAALAEAKAGREAQNAVEAFRVVREGESGGAGVGDATA